MLTGAPSRPEATAPALRGVATGRRCGRNFKEPFGLLSRQLPQDGGEHGETSERQEHEPPAVSRWECDDGGPGVRKAQVAVPAAVPRAGETDRASVSSSKNNSLPRP